MLPVHRIIPFSNVEGMGNRTSIFLQKCNLNCLYCHNPEMIGEYHKDTNDTSVEKLIEIIKGNMPFIRGITVSGGEATLHDKELVNLFDEVHKLGITCYIDTNGYFDVRAKSGLVDRTDKFLFDVKGYGSSMKYLCFDTKNIDGIAKDGYEDIQDEKTYDNLDNLKYLLELNKVEEVRLVYVKNFYDEYMVVDKIAELIKDKEDVLFKLIRVHLKGARDPKSLARYMPSSQDVKKLEDYARQKGIKNIFTINM